MVIFHSWFTVVLLLLLVGIAIWAFSSKRKKDFDEAARLPFSGDNVRPESDRDRSDKNGEDQ